MQSTPELSSRHETAVSERQDASKRAHSVEDIGRALDARLEELGAPRRDALGAYAKEAFDAVAQLVRAADEAGHPLADEQVALGLAGVAELARREAVLDRPPSSGRPQVLDPKTFAIRPQDGTLALAGAYPKPLVDLLRGLGVDPRNIPPDVARAIMETANSRSGCDLEDPRSWRLLGEQVLSASLDAAMSEAMSTVAPGSIPDSRSVNGREPQAHSRSRSREGTGNAGSAGNAGNGGKGDNAGIDVPVPFSSRNAAFAEPTLADGARSRPDYVGGVGDPKTRARTPLSSRSLAPPQSPSSPQSTKVGEMPRRHADSIEADLAPIFEEAGLSTPKARREAMNRLRGFIQTARSEVSDRSPSAVQLYIVSSALDAADTSPAMSDLRRRLDRLALLHDQPSPSPDALETWAGRAVAALVLPGRTLSEERLRDLARLTTQAVSGRPNTLLRERSCGLPGELDGRRDDPEGGARALLEGVLPSTASGIEVRNHRLDPAEVGARALPALHAILETSPKDRVDLASRAIEWLKAHGANDAQVAPEETALLALREHLPELDERIAALGASLTNQKAGLDHFGSRVAKTRAEVEHAATSGDPTLNSLRDKLALLTEAEASLRAERESTAKGLESAKRGRSNAEHDLDALMRRVLAKVVDHSVSPKETLAAADEIAPSFVAKLSDLMDSPLGRGVGSSGTGPTGVGPTGEADVVPLARSGNGTSVSDRGARERPSLFGRSPDAAATVPGGPGAISGPGGGASSPERLTLAQERARVCAEILRDPALSLTDKIVLFVLMFAYYVGAEHQEHLRELAEIDQREADWEALHRQLANRSDALEKQRTLASDNLEQARSLYEEAVRANGGRETGPTVSEARQSVVAAEEKLSTIDKLRIEVNQKEQEVLKNKPSEPRDLIMTKMQRLSQLREMMLKFGNDFMEEEKRLLERINRF